MTGESGEGKETKKQKLEGGREKGEERSLRCGRDDRRGEEKENQKLESRN